MKHMDIKSLAQEFFGAPSAAEFSININSGDMSVLERWFSELDVAWVLHLPNGDDASAELHQTSSERWIRGLHRVLETIRSTSVMFLGLPDVCEQEDQPVPESDKQANNVPDQIRFARFAKEAMSKMLSFVDFAIRQVDVCINGLPPAPYKKLHTLLAVYKALSDAPDKFGWSFYYSSEGVGRILQEMEKVLSAKWEEVGEAIWSTIEPIRTRVLESIDIEYGDNSSSSPMPQASSDIHKATLSPMEYISFMCSNYSSMCQIVSKAVRFGKYEPPIRQQNPLDSMIMDMMSCLQKKKLVKMSESFPDQGLGFLFLLNNIEFIRQSIMDSHFWYWLLYHEEGEALSEKVESYMENYLQACWEPMLSYLLSPTPTPLCFGINHYSPLLKFESEFKKTYATQKLWKVPDPKLRKRLRTTIAKKIVPRYTEYIEENDITTPGVAPRDLEKMLQELFEG
jgi:hypothetical protein